VLFKLLTLPEKGCDSGTNGEDREARKSLTGDGTTRPIQWGVLKVIELNDASRGASPPIGEKIYETRH
jgi:hypothetical protein